MTRKNFHQFVDMRVHLICKQRTFFLQLSLASLSDLFLKTGLGRDTCGHLCNILRAKEAQLGRRQLESPMLKVEGTRWSRCHGDSQSICQCAKRGMEASHIGLESHAPQPRLIIEGDPLTILLGCTLSRICLLVSYIRSKFSVEPENLVVTYADNWELVAFSATVRLEHVLRSAQCAFVMPICAECME